MSTRRQPQPNRSAKVAPGSTSLIDLARLILKIRPGDRFVFTGDMQSGSSNVNIGATWVERV